MNKLFARSIALSALAVSAFTVVSASVFINDAKANHCGIGDFTGSCLHRPAENRLGVEPDRPFFAPPYLPDYHAEYPMFDAQWYLSNNADVNNACKGSLQCAKQHYLANGLKECRNASLFFNPRWYLENNPDVKQVFVDCRGASEHWSGAGRKEGRKGAP